MEHTRARTAKQFSGWTIVMTIVLSVTFALSLNAAQNAAPPNKPDQKAAEPSPCPEGQARVKQMTPFGPMEVCAAAPANAPAQSAPVPATPPVSAPQTPAQTGAPAAQQPAAPKEEPKPAPPAATSGTDVAKGVEVNDGAVALNLENADLYQVLRILGPELKINTIIDPAVKGAVTVNTSGSVSRKDLFGLMEMILEINGATAVKQPNGYYAIVPIGDARKQPLDFHYAKQADHPPGPEAAYTLEVVAMKFMPASEMSKILTPFMSAAGQIVVHDKGNVLLISDSAAKIAELREIINIFDDPVLGRQRIHLFPVKNNLAANLIPELKSIFAGYGLTSGSTAMQLVPMEGQNIILAISPSPEVFPEIEHWIEKLDQPSESVGIRNFVYKVQNAKATDLQNILTSLYGGGTVPTAAANPSPADTGMGATGQPTPANVMGPPNGVAAAPAPSAPRAPNGPESAYRLQGDLRIMADERNNTLIVQTTPHDYEILEHTLRDLDVLPRQVMIDARIYEVDLTGDLSLGLNAFLDKKQNLPTIATNGSFSAASGLVAQTFAILHNSYELQLFLTASENRTRVKTLSAPSILVTDNTTARVQVGAEVPVPIGSALTPVQSGGSSIFAQTIQMRDTGVILSVTPRINASGIVTLNIGQEVSSAQPNGTSAIVAPVINKSQFQTTAILRDGQTLALGGIITSSSNLNKQRIPLIGDIPGLGALFGSTSLGTTRKELVMLITPHVAQDMNEAGSISADFVHQLKNLKKDLKNVNTTPQGK